MEKIPVLIEIEMGHTKVYKMSSCWGLRAGRAGILFPESCSELLGNHSEQFETDPWLPRAAIIAQPLFVIQHLLKRLASDRILTSMGASGKHSDREGK